MEKEFKEALFDIQLERLDDLSEQAGAKSVLDEDENENFVMNLIEDEDSANAYIAFIKQMEAMAYSAGFKTISEFMETLIKELKNDYEDWLEED